MYRFFPENKVILVHRALTFFPCNAKQENYLTLSNKKIFNNKRHKTKSRIFLLHIIR